MRVKCVICDTIQQLEDDLPLAKKLRNRPINTFMCETCNTRIAENTEKRILTGKFHAWLMYFEVSASPNPRGCEAGGWGTSGQGRFSS